VPLIRAIQRNRYKAGDEFVAPRPLHEVKPRLPARLVRELPGEVRVDFKLSIDKAGLVRAVELRSFGVEDRLAEIAASAVHDWRFEPATLRGKPVSSEILVALHFHNPIPNSTLAQRQLGKERPVE
jgi:protein TonB